ncbi:MAG: hypothetical protein FWE08_06370 [Oscillospiraceae bacterium]|nr:hypothetical protein [Oscillospiraceae bacterium]
MKKRLLALLLVFVMMVSLLTGCADMFGNLFRRPAETPMPQETVEPEETSVPTSEANVQRDGFPQRGSWDGDVFTSEYLGLQFTMPSGWVAVTDEELADAMGIGFEFMERETDYHDLMELFGLLAVIEMGAACMFTGGNINITFERLTFPQNRLTAEEYIALSSETVAEMMGSEITYIFPDATRIGAYDWYSYSYVMDMFGMDVFGRQFVSIENGFARIITITSFDGIESVDDVLAMFDAL